MILRNNTGTKTVVRGSKVTIATTPAASVGGGNSTTQIDVQVGEKMVNITMPDRNGKFDQFLNVWRN